MSASSAQRRLRCGQQDRAPPGRIKFGNGRARYSASATSPEFFSAIKLLAALSAVASTVESCIHRQTRRWSAFDLLSANMEVCLQCFNIRANVATLNGANGLLKFGARVQVQIPRRLGGDNLWYLATVTSLRDDNTATVDLDANFKYPNDNGVNARDVYLVPKTHPGYKKRSTVGVAEQGEYKDEFEVNRKKQLWDGGGVRG